MLRKNKLWVNIARERMENNWMPLSLAVDKAQSYIFGNTITNIINHKDDKRGYFTVKFSGLWVFAIKEAIEQVFDFACEITPSSVGDLLVSSMGASIHFEVKSTLGKDFQGCTHSDKKSNDYIFIKYALNENMDLCGSLKGFITGLHICVFDGLDNSYWKGSANEKNSRTSLKVPISVCEEWRTKMICGTIRPMKKWCDIQVV